MGRITIAAGPRSTSLRRPVTARPGNGISAEQAAAAREILAHGREVSISYPDWRRGVIIVGLVATFVASILLGIFVNRIVGFVPLVVFALPWLVRGKRPIQPPQESVVARRLQGTRVSGTHRGSRTLWSRAVREVEAGRRAEADLPAVYPVLLELASAEDAVDRLLRRDRYDVDQSDVERAREAVAALVRDARSRLGIAPELPPADYRANRWAEEAGLPEPDPANPDDLR